MKKRSNHIWNVLFKTVRVYTDKTALFGKECRPPIVFKRLMADYVYYIYIKYIPPYWTRGGQIRWKAWGLKRCQRQGWKAHGSWMVPPDCSSKPAQYCFNWREVEEMLVQQNYWTCKLLTLFYSELVGPLNGLNATIIFYVFLKNKTSFVSGFFPPLATNEDNEMETSYKTFFPFQVVFSLFLTSWTFLVSSLMFTLFLPTSTSIIRTIYNQTFEVLSSSSFKTF